MYCKKCGFQISETDKFCPNCGESNNAQPVQPEVQSVEPVQTAQPEVQPVQTPTMQPANQGVQPTPNNQNKDNKKLIITIVAIAVGVAVAVLVGLLVFNNNGSKSSKDSDKKKTNINEYEDDIVPDIIDDDNDITTTKDDTNTTTTTTTTDTSSTITYKGFKFNKLSGYTYEETSNGLQISDSSSVTILNIISGSFDVIKNNYTSLKSSFEEKGYEVENLQVKTYGTVEYVSADVKQGGLSMILLYGKADSSHIYVIVVANKSYTIDSSLVYKVNSIIRGAVYVG